MDTIYECKKISPKFLNNPEMQYLLCAWGKELVIGHFLTDNKKMYYIHALHCVYAALY